MTVLEAIKKANQPGSPENSVRLRCAVTGCALVGVAACSSQGELSHSTALLLAALISAGTVFSYRTRSRPPNFIKVVAALAALSLLVWFVHSLSGGPITDITTVEDPLTILFAGIQAVHSFHVPARRDLIFTISGAAGLMALAAAQSIDLGFVFYAVPWLCLTLWAMVELWRSVSQGAWISIRATAAAVGAVVTAALIIFLILPAPSVSIRTGFVTSPGDGGPLPAPGALAGDSGRASQLSKPGSPAGRSRIGGYLGFANHLDTALRGNLDKTLLMRVRAQRPSYWIGETYNRWDGRNWISTVPADQTVHGGSPFYLGLPFGDLPGGHSDLQTFYLASSSPNLVFHADAARQVWFPAASLDYGPDGTIISPIGLGKGAVYTVQSYVNDVSPSDLRSSNQFSSSFGANLGIYSQLPHAYPRAAALASTVTANAPTTYDKVDALIAWVGAHTRYSTTIPPLAAGQDTVDDFLFGSRVGFCEQISTALAVMLRTLGIPAREVVGYIPGPYNPVTDLYDVRADDAHAWVQVWFPGFGWQSFDPTAAVPSANPSPGGSALRSVEHALSGLPPVPAAIGAAGLGSFLLARRWKRSRPQTWSESVTREMERAGRHRRRSRGTAETLLDYAVALDIAGAGYEAGANWSALASAVSAASYGGRAIDATTQHALIREARRLRKLSSRHVRRPGRSSSASKL